VKLELAVNGRSHEVDVPPAARLLDVLRAALGLTGTKEGCGEGECGACTMILDGAPVMSCLVPVIQAAGRQILTVEGVAADGRLEPVQEAFARLGGAQCGICTPGMILAARAWLADPGSAENVGEALAGNLCRCTGYTKIFEAVEAARSAAAAGPAGAPAAPAARRG
jgi:carbon-monoxide dehydrogenase small subunit